MKPILILSFWNPTDLSPNKGMFIRDQVNALSENRRDIVFLGINILSSDDIFPKIEIIKKEVNSNKHITITIYSVFWKLIYVSPSLSYTIIKKYLRKNGISPSIIHSNVVFPCGIVGYRLARKYKAKHVISEHWSKAEKLLKHPIFRATALNCYRSSDAILCVSNFLAHKIRLLTGSSNVMVVPNIIDTNVFKFIPKESATSLTFTCVATWKKPKRLDLIIHSLIAFSAISNKKVILNVIGSGIQTEELKKLKFPQNFTVNWLGYMSKLEISKILIKTSFFMHASEIETFSIVTVEALTTGTPVLASNTGALPELINPSNGILVKNSIDAWIKGLSMIIENHYDHDAIAKEFSSKFSPHSVAQRIIEVYNEALLS